MQKCRFYPHTHNNSYPLVPLGGFPTLYPFPSSFPSLLSLTISVASQRKNIFSRYEATRHHIGEVTQVVQPSRCWFPILHNASSLLQSLGHSSGQLVLYYPQNLFRERRLLYLEAKEYVFVCLTSWCDKVDFSIKYLGA